MKILLIFTFYLISGPVSCFDVIGYSGGTVMIYCTIPQNRGNNGFFCKGSGTKCVYLNPNETPNTWDHNDKVSVHQLHGFLTVIYRDLSLEDTGLYLCGETGKWSDTINLNVKTDDCCSGPNTVIGYLGETVTINCSYPEEHKKKAKFFYKQDFDEFVHVIGTNDSQKGTSSKNLNERFSISEDRSSNVFTLITSDVIQDDDGGDYYCGVSDDEGAGSYETFFIKIHLQVTGPTPPTPTSPVTTSDYSSVIITVIVVLLLIGGAALVFFIVILKKKQGSTPSTRTNQSDQKEVPVVVNNYEETGLTIQTLPKDQDLTHSTQTPPKDQDLTHSTQTPPKDQDLTHSTLTPPKDQEITYSTVSFHKNPGSSTDASVTISKEEPETEYATIKNPKRLE